MKVVIVGGVAGGASAAARLRRLDEEAQIILFERGPYISYANCGLPYYIGGTIKERNRLLVQTADNMRARFKIDVRLESEVLEILRDQKQVRVHKDGSTYLESYDKLILSPGAEPVVPKISGLGDVKDRVFTLRTLPDTDKIVDYLNQNKPQRAVVVGAGFIGLEMAENLKIRGLDVSLVEMAPQVMDALDPEMAAFIHQELRQQGIKLYLGEMVDGLTAGPKVKVHLASQKELDADLVILAIGVRPEVKLARDAGLEIGTRGGIITNPSLQTTDPDIYAVGDAIEVKNPLHEEQVIVPLAGPANKQGRIAADHIQGRDVEYRGSMGTAIVKVFDLAAGSVGSNEKSLKARNVPYHSCIVHPLSHAGYYPGGSLLSIKLLFDPQGKILGGQVVGAGGVDKRIDVLATAMHFGGTVWDLTKLEHAYAPPFSSAKDPVNMAGFVAGNILSADVATINWDQIQDLDPEQSFILDVREPEEYEAGHIPGSTLVPLNSLREHLDELPRDKEIIVYCRVGLRAYLGARILMQHGFEKVKNLSGGYITYSTIMSDLASKLPPPPAGTIAHNEPGTASKLEEGQVPESIVVLDACGLQCPGPIRLVFEKMKELSAGDYLEVHATDPGFIIDLESWSQRTGNQLLATGKENGKFVATLRKGSQEPALEKGHDKTLIVFSSELDRAIASLVIATGAASMRRKVTMFFTFWGLNVLRKPEKVAVQKQGLERAFGWMMPRGSKKLGLSKMNMLGIGPRLIRKVMAKKNVDSLEALLGQAKLMGVRLVACQMSMDVMGIKPEELIDGVEIGGVATYLAAAETSDTNLFI